MATMTENDDEELEIIETDEIPEQEAEAPAEPESAAPEPDDDEEEDDEDERFGESEEESEEEIVNRNRMKRQKRRQARKQAQERLEAEVRMLRDINADLLKKVGGIETDLASQRAHVSEQRLAAAQDEVRQAEQIIARAVEKGGGIDNVSPDRFANQVRDLGKSVNIFFTGDDLKRVQGLARVLNSTKRAGEAAALPPSGVQNFYAMLGIGGAGVGGGLPGAVATAAGMASVGGAARLYESAVVRNLLMKFPQVRPGSAEEAELLKRLMSTLAAEQQVQTPPQPEEQE